MAIPVETTERPFTSDYCYLIVWVLRPPTKNHGASRVSRVATRSSQESFGILPFL
ncbi:hypothetical protein FIBSPDRAFT_860305 [Athelia psychrophila]|uniref:Uncharacterized protein n=1 Tax=Athelia psychrophila TaxID=1759441 RepID=A0A166K9N1_9AGAM|nr:hypothetical protein FIBSPDRAFT_860305 [Fibularhizoctonia sp. CBS 109695]